jgi:hypothetical protein
VLVKFNDLYTHFIRILAEFIAVAKPDNYTAVFEQVKYSDTKAIHLNSKIDSNLPEIQAHFI